MPIGIGMSIGAHQRVAFWLTQEVDFIQSRLGERQVIEHSATVRVDGGCNCAIASIQPVPSSREGGG